MSDGEVRQASDSQVRQASDSLVHGGHSPRSVVGGGHPRPTGGSEDRGHQPASGSVEPTVGPSSGSGVSSASTTSTDASGTD